MSKMTMDKNKYPWMDVEKTVGNTTDENNDNPWMHTKDKISIDDNWSSFWKDFEKPLVLVRDENDELQWESTLRALNVIKKDASQWTEEDKQVVADAYREAWQDKDCQSLDKMTSAMCDKSYGEITSSIALLGRNYERSCEIMPNADKYKNVLEALDNKNDAELYYTVNRIGRMPSQTLSIEADNPNNLNAYADYLFQKTDEGMKVSLTTSAYGVDRTENYAIISMDMNKQISEAGIRHLKDIGYEDSEIEAFKRCALTDTDAAFLNKLAEGDYESAYRVDPSQLSYLTKMQLSTYQTIYATRERKSEYPADAQKQANILFNQDNAASHDEVPDNAYQEYFTVISNGMANQNTMYGKVMQSVCGNLTTENDAFFEYGAELNRVNVLWDTFEALYNRKHIEIFEASFGHALRDKDINLQISNLHKSENGDVYAYEVTIADPQTDTKSDKWNCTVKVDCQKDTGMDILTNMVLDENISNLREIGKLKQGLVTNIPMTVVDNLYPVSGVNAATQMFTGLFGQNLKAGDVNDAVKAVGSELGNWKVDALDNIGKGLGLLSEVSGEYISAQEKIKELDKEISHNRQYLNYCHNGELNKMNIFIKNDDTGMYASQSLNVGWNNITPEVRYNMMRWSKEGIIACLEDLGVKDPEAVKEEMWVELTSDLKIKEITAMVNENKTIDEDGKKRNVTEDDVKKGIGIMLNGGDFSTIVPEVREHLQSKLGGVLREDYGVALENGMYSWLKRRNLPEASEQDSSAELQTQKQTDVTPLQDYTEDIIFKDELPFEALPSGVKKVNYQDYLR